MTENKVTELADTLQACVETVERQGLDTVSLSPKTVRLVLDYLEGYLDIVSSEARKC